MAQTIHCTLTVVAITCVATLALCGLVVNCTTCEEQNNAQLVTFNKRSTGAKSPNCGVYRLSAVAADAAPCSKIGMDILVAKKGSAVDAAIATMLCLGVINPQSSGIGGGHTMAVYDYPRHNSNNQEMTTFTAIERVPLAYSNGVYVNNINASMFGGVAMLVPGEILGFYREWQKFGKIPWRELFLPAIRLCQKGFSITKHLGDKIDEALEKVNMDDDLKKTFLNPDGSLRKAGEILKLPLLGRTLETLSHDPLAFYNRESQLAKDIVADLQEKGGSITLDDLENYYVSQKQPLKTHLTNGNYSVYSVRPPSGGAVYQYIMKILDGYNFQPSDYSDVNKRSVTYHRITEAIKFAYASRTELGDEDFVPDVQELIRNMTSKEYADETRAKIQDDKTHEISYYLPTYDPYEDFGTTHASILSPDGSAVAVTSTINSYFGSGVMGSRTGIIFNNKMSNFCFPKTCNRFSRPPLRPNFMELGKMPMSSTCPSIILDNKGKVKMVTGASGAARSTTAVALVTMNALWFNLGLEKATELPRIHHQLFPNKLELEEGIDERFKHDLEEKGHRFIEADGISVVQSILKNCNDDDCNVHAASDWRKHGEPCGY